MEALIWVAVGLVAYSYLVYPLLMMLIGRSTVRAPTSNAPRTHYPTVALVVAAHDEERHIDERIRNFLEIDYPADRLTLYVGSDGSTDRTVALAERHASSRVRVLAFAERRGKASVLNDLLAAVREDLVVFTDANTVFDRAAVSALVRQFDDARVGAVSGELKLHRKEAGDNQDDRYWRFETALKVGESRIGGLLGANGGIYAIRRPLYRPLPADTIVDDFTIVMNVSAQGARTVFEPAAVAFEDAPPGIDQEFRRRIRIGIGNYQAFFRHPEYWLRAGPVRFFTYFSHKVVRWFAPHLLLVALLANVLVAPREPYGLLLALQLVGYGVLGVGMLLRRYVQLPRIVNIPLFVFALNVAFLVGFWRYVTGNVSGTWGRTQRA